MYKAPLTSSTRRGETTIREESPNRPSVAKASCTPWVFGSASACCEAARYSSSLRGKAALGAARPWKPRLFVTGAGGAGRSIWAVLTGIRFRLDLVDYEVAGFLSAAEDHRRQNGAQRGANDNGRDGDAEYPPRDPEFLFPW